MRSTECPSSYYSNTSARLICDPSSPDHVTMHWSTLHVCADYWICCNLSLCHNDNPHTRQPPWWWPPFAAVCGSIRVRILPRGSHRVSFLSFSLSFFYEVAHAPFTYQCWNLHHGLAQCTASGVGQVWQHQARKYGFSRRNKILHCSAYAMAEINPFRHADYDPDRAQKLISSSMSDICRHTTFHPNPCTRFWVILHTDRQTDRQTNERGCVGEDTYLLHCRR